MRVAIISHTYLLNANRGKVRALARIAGVDVLLVVPRTWQNRDLGQHFRVDASDPGPPPITPLRSLSWGSGTLISYDVVALVRVLRRFRPDVVHLEEEPWSLAALELVWICRVLRIPLTFFTWENSNRSLPLPFRLIQRSLLCSASAAVAGNAQAKSKLVRLGFHKPIVVLPQLGVDTTVFRPRNPSEFAGRVVGFVGRLVRHKGILSLAQAVGRLPPDVRLLVVGNGPLNAELRQIAHAVGLEGRFELHENVPHHQVPRYLQQMSVLVLPSLATDRWKEQFGHVLIEAMACGVPVIGTNSGSIPEVIGEAGIVVPEGDVAMLATTVFALLSDPVRRQELALRGRARVDVDYTDAAISSRLAAFLESVIKEAGQGEHIKDLEILA